MAATKISLAQLNESELLEHIQDTIASTLVAGTNVTINYDDPGNTVTINASGGGGGGGSLPSGTSGQTLRYDATNTPVASSALTNDGTTIGASDMNLNGKISLSGDISPSVLTADVNDYNPTSWSSNSVILLSSDSGIRHITGLDGGIDGRLVVFQNNGDYPFVFPPEHAGSTAVNRWAGKSDVYCFPGRSVSWRYDATANRWRLMDYTGDFDYSYPTLVARSYNAASATSGDWGNLNFHTNGAGASNAASSAISTTQYSIVFSATGSTSVGSAGVTYNKLTIPYWGLGTYRKNSAMISIPVLSTATERFIAYFRESNTNTPTSLANNTIGMRYTDDVNGGAFQCFARDNAGAETVINTAITVSAGVNYNLEYVFNKNMTEVRFFIDGVYQGAITTNLPNTGGSYVSGASIVKTVGTTSRTINWLKGNTLYFF